MVGLAVVQVPPELEQQGRQLNTHAQQLQRHSQGARDALAYLRATDALARHSYIDAIRSELQRLRPVDLGATLRAPPSGSAFVEDAASPGRAPQSDMDILSDWQ